MRVRKGIVIVSLLLALAALLSGCSAATGGSVTLKVLAGSELKDLEPLFSRIRRNTGINLEMEYIGTLDGAEQVLTGREDIDLAWFSHAKYLTLLQGNQRRVLAQEKTMLSPVVLGVKKSQAREWGWDANDDLTWQDVVDKAASGELQFGMTNPSSSNSGFTALVGVASALAGSGDALNTDDIDRVAPRLGEFFRGQALTSGSSGWLAEQYVEEQERLDGLVNYESVLLLLNKSGELREDLRLVYPKEGIITADYPLMLLKEEHRDDYQKLVEYLRSEAFQELMMEETLRRPINPQVRLSNDFPDDLLVEVAFPNTAEVIDYLIFSYLDEQRVPSHAFFVLDVSGSMRGNRLADLKQALNNLTGEDTSLTGQFARFRDRERITLIPFNATVRDIRSFEIDMEDPTTMYGIRDYVDALQAGGDTAIYDSLAEAYRLAQEAKQQHPERYYSIVLMSDGENTAGMSWSRFRRYYQNLPDSVQQVKTFTILFGQADEEAMHAIADETGGRAFDAKSHELGLIFKQIRGYQ